MLPLGKLFPREQGLSQVYPAPSTIFSKQSPLLLWKSVNTENNNVLLQHFPSSGMMVCCWLRWSQILWYSTYQAVWGLWPLNLGKLSLTSRIQERWHWASLGGGGAHLKKLTAFIFPWNTCSWNLSTILWGSTSSSCGKAQVERNWDPQVHSQMKVHSN